MKVLLLDADGINGFPNLALMKISAYYKTRGHQITLIKGIPTTPPLEEFDIGFASCVFFQNRDRLLDYADQLPFYMTIGGSGYDLQKKLPSEIEHLRPDYELYPTPFSLGFTSRGCIRKCAFCIVPEKEGTICDHAPISEFHDPTHDKVVLLDNNFLASPRWRENLDFIEEHGLKVNFNQGLDIRFVNREAAERLAAVDAYGWHFKTKGLYFAFDSLSIENNVRRGIELLSEVGIAPRKLLFYVLIGYDSTEEEDLRRIEIIKELGAVPFVMPYNQHKSPLTRWVNRRYYQFVPYEKYCEAKTE